MFHVEHAKNQKSAKIEICGFFWVLTNNFGAGAPVVSQRLFSCVARKRVTKFVEKVIVYILARGRQCESDNSTLGVACADYSALSMICQVFFVNWWQVIHN